MAEPTSDLTATFIHTPNELDVQPTAVGEDRDTDLVGSQRENTGPEANSAVQHVTEAQAEEEMKAREMENPVGSSGSSESIPALDIDTNTTQTAEQLVKQVDQTLEGEDTEIEPHVPPQTNGVIIPQTSPITVEGTSSTSEGEEPTEIERSQETVQKTESSSSEPQLRVGQKVKRKRSTGQIVEGWEINSIDLKSGKYFLVRSDQVGMSIQEFKVNGAPIINVPFSELEALNPELITKVTEPPAAQ